jgi:cell division protein FtsB
LLQSAYSDYQIGPFENLHQPVKNTPLVILGARLKVYFQYSLRFADRLNSQLLISHASCPQKTADR